MPSFEGEESELQQELKSALKRAQHSENRLVDQDNEVRRLKEQNEELSREVKEMRYKAQHEAGNATKANEALSKTTAAYNNLKVQKENAETALYAAEGKLKERDGEIRRLEYQLEVTSVRSASTADKKVAEEKATLEKRVHQLTMDLQRTQIELEKEKTSSAAATSSESISVASKIARPASRSSNVASDAGRGRFGFQPSAPSAPSSAVKRRTSVSIQSDSQPSSIRPPSSLSMHSSIPGPTASKLPARRPSITGSAPSAVNTSSSQSNAQQTAKLSQLESTLSSAQETISHLSSELASAQASNATLESTISTLRTQLEQKKSESLRIENQLMALERTTKDQLGEMADKLEEAKEEMEMTKEELREVREEMNGEIEQIRKEAKEERQELEARTNELVAELESLEGELERREGEREDMIRMLDEAKEEVKDLQEALDEQQEECEDLGNELAYLEETHDQALEDAKEEREALEAEIADLKEVKAQLEAQEEDIEGMEGNREELERLLEEATEGRTSLEQQLASALRAQTTLQTQVDELLNREGEWQAEIAELQEELTLRRSDGESNLEGSLADRVALLEEEVEKKDTEVKDLSGRLANLDELASERDNLKTQVESLVSEVDRRIEEVETLSAKLAESDAAHSSLRQVLDDHEITSNDLQNTIDSITAERDALRRSSIEQSEALMALQASLKELENAPNRSQDDEQLEDLRARLEETEQEVVALRERVKELEDGEWTSEETLKTLLTRIEELEADAVVLKETVDAERGTAMTVELDLGLAKKTLEETQRQLSVVEGLLESETRAREALDQAHVADKVKEDDYTSKQIEDLELELEEVHAQLDDLRASTEDESFAHLQEVTELQLRLRAQENEIEDLQRESYLLEALRRILGETETRLDSLGWELKQEQLAKKEQAKAAEEKIDTLTKRAEAAEDDGLRLRTELDESRHKLSDAQDALDQAQAQAAIVVTESAETSAPPLYSPSPSQTNLSFNLSPSADPSILVIRLREERDELRERLDFARNEARFRVASLQERLKLSEQNKARELSIMEIDLMDKSVALQHESDTNVKVEEALRIVRSEKEEIEAELEVAKKQLKEATAKTDEVEKKLRVAEKAQEEREAERESAWALEGELEAATRSADSVRAELDSVNTANRELSETLDSLRHDLREAAAELDRQHSTSAEAEARIVELETALKTAQREEESRQTNALADFATLCETLESEAANLRSKISQQTDLIVERERSISLLQLNLAVRVAIEDDEDLADPEQEQDAVAEEDHVGDATIAVDPSSSPSHLADLETRLADELSIRLTLEDQLVKVQAALDGALQEVRLAETSSTDLKKELEEAQSMAKDRQERLDDASSTLQELQARHDAINDERRTLTEKIESLRADLARLERTNLSHTETISDLEETVNRKTLDLDEASKQIVELEALLEEARAEEAASTAAQETISKLETELADVDSRLSETLAELTLSNEKTYSAQTALEALQKRFATLTAAHQEVEVAFDAQKESRALAVAEAEEEIARLRQQLIVAEEESIVREQAQTRIALLEEQLAATRSELEMAGGSAEEVVELSARLEVALREIEALSTLVQQERTTASRATREMEEAVAAEQATIRDARTEIEQLAAELDESRSETGSLENHLREVIASNQHAKAEAEAKYQNEMAEVIDALTAEEKKLADAEEEVKELKARVQELEQLLDEKMVDVDEADEKLIEALKLQKRYTAQIERLKAKVSTLQRDLVAARSAAPLPPSTSPSLPPSQLEATVVSNSNKKRRAPAEFDPLPEASPAPRAIVAARLPTATNDKENASTETGERSRPTSLSASKPVRLDSLVPLKPEQIVVKPRRDALRSVDENTTEGQQNKMAGLRARLAERSKGGVSSRSGAILGSTRPTA